MACSEGQRSSRPAKALPRWSTAGFHYETHQARFVLHRGDVSAIHRCAEGQKGLRICIGRGGEVFRDTPPRATLLEQLAPEPLTDVWVTRERVALLGRSGTVYPLDAEAHAIERALGPPVPLVRSARTGALLLGLDEAGALWKSVDVGASWQKSEGEATSLVPRSLRLFELATDDSGRVAMLGAPEGIVVSSDQGAHFSALPWKPLGATSLGRDAQGQLRVYSVLEEPRLLLPQSASVTAPEKTHRLKYALAQYLTARDFVERRVAYLGANPGANPGANLGDPWLVLRREGTDYVTYRGGIGRPLGEPAIARGLDCPRLRALLNGRTLVAICSSMQPLREGAPRADESVKARALAPLSLFVSDDLGRSFQPVVSRFSAVEERFLAVGVPGTDRLLLSGMVLDETLQNQSPQAPKLAYGVTLTAGTHPGEPLRAVAVPLRLPALAEPPLALVASKLGGALAIVARREKGERLTYFSSSDRGETFAEQPLELPPSPAKRVPKPSAEILGRDFVARETHAEGPVFERKLTHASLTEDGQLTLVSRWGDAKTLVTVMASGGAQTTATPPRGTSQLAATEAGALAFSVTEGRLYESLNWGADFLPIAQLKGKKLAPSEDPTLVCVDASCVLGDTLSRVGFGEGKALVATAFARASSESAPAAISAPPSCRLAGKGFRSLSGVGPLPSAMTAAYGDTGIYWLAREPKTRGTSLSVLRRGRRDWQRETLFPKGSGATAAAHARFRSELGFAVARVLSGRDPTAPLGRVELDFWNGVTDVRHRMTVDIPELTGATVSSSADGTWTFSPSLLMPLGDALLIGLGAPSASAKVSRFWLAFAGKLREVRLPASPGLNFDQGAFGFEAGRVSWLGLDENRSVLRRLEEGGETPLAMTVAPPSPPPEARGAWPGHLGETLGIFARDGVLWFRQLSKGEARDGSLSESSLGRGFPSDPCRGTLEPARRFLVHPRAAERRKITLELGDGGRVELVTERAVAYAGATGTCWAALEAFDQERQYSLLWFADEPKTVLLFHQDGGDSTQGELLWSPLECEPKSPLG